MARLISGQRVHWAPNTCMRERQKPGISSSQPPLVFWNPVVSVSLSFSMAVLAAETMGNSGKPLRLFSPSGEYGFDDSHRLLVLFHFKVARMESQELANNEMMYPDIHTAVDMPLSQRNPLPGKQKVQVLGHSDDDEAQVGDDGKREKIPPWHRMKWTDDMVRLLIMVVYYIGDEVVVSDGSEKKKGGGGSGVLQKKGKWKSVSKAMMEKGFFVSPQQCEDKFNDLNKRYKRVNDILGKGTSCKVVENPSLLDKLHHLSNKMKEEVKKLLSSKHLFFREMCAYHNSCGHGAGAGAGSHHSPMEDRDQTQMKENAQPQVPNLNKPENEEEGKSATVVVICENDDEEEEEEEDEENEADNEDDGDDDEDEDERALRKRARKEGSRSHTHSSAAVEQLEADVMKILQDASRSDAEKREWMRGRMTGLEEQRISIVTQSFELEKQRFKWLKFSSKKEREMEKEKLMNERLNLENERMMLLLRHKELDMIHHHLQQAQHHHHHATSN